MFAFYDAKDPNNFVQSKELREHFKPIISQVLNSFELNLLPSKELNQTIDDLNLDQNEIQSMARKATSLYAGGDGDVIAKGFNYF